MDLSQLYKFKTPLWLDLLSTLLVLEEQQLSQELPCLDSYVSGSA